MRKRAHGFLESGHDVLSFSFRRDRYQVGYQPDWPNVELGRSTERRLLQRVVLCAAALRAIVRHRRDWRRASVIYARNLDLALLAWVARWLTWSQAPLVYEVLDIHPALLGSRWTARVARWWERRILRRCRMLVVSSAGFVENYFRPIQGYAGDVFLLENKWPTTLALSQPRRLQYLQNDGRPQWTIGWFGNIRCSRSLAILCRVADRLGDRVRIYLRGCASFLGTDELAQAVAGRPNIEFGGEYSAPDELAEIYSQVHWNWCVDFSGGENGRWLIPNRIYEGGFFGIPAIAIAGHHTAEVVRSRNLGVVIEEPYAERLCELLERTTWEEYRRLRESIESQPLGHFVDHGALGRLIEQVTR